MDVIAIGNANIDNLILTEKFAENDEKILIKNVKKFVGGGAANFAVGISRLGLRSGFVGCIGNDENGILFKKTIENEKVDTNFLKVYENELTGFTIIINTQRGEHAIYAYRGANNKLELNREILNYLNKAKIIHLASINHKVLKELISLRENIKAKLSIDPGRILLSKGFDDLKGMLSSFDFLFMNKNEFKVFLGEDPTKQHVLKVAKKLSLTLSVQMGKNGSLVSNGKTIHHINAFKIRKVVDTTAAGDSYAVGFIFGCLKNKSMTDCALLGHAVAAIKIQREGALQVMPRLDELKEFLIKNKLDIKV